MIIGYHHALFVAINQTLSLAVVV
jgi:hypothetical protein